MSKKKESVILDAVQLGSVKDLKTVVFTGSRDFTNLKTDMRMVWQCLERFVGLLPKDCKIYHGGARGADSMLNHVASKYDDIEAEAVYANWDCWGNQAGSVRNYELLDKKPQAVVYFTTEVPLQGGTAHMVKIAQEAGIPVYSGNRLMNHPELKYRFKESFLVDDTSTTWTKASTGQEINVSDIIALDNVEGRDPEENTERETAERDAIPVSEGKTQREINALNKADNLIKEVRASKTK